MFLGRAEPHELMDMRMLGKIKLKLFERWMEGEHVLLHLDSRKPGVIVPEHLSNDYRLTLKLSYAFQGRVSSDLDGVYADLRFSGSYVHCVIPWESVWGMTSSSGESQMWSEDLPREMVLQLAKSQLKELGKKFLTVARRSRETDAGQTAGKKIRELSVVPGKLGAHVGDDYDLERDESGEADDHVQRMSSARQSFQLVDVQKQDLQEIDAADDSTGETESELGSDPAPATSDGSISDGDTSRAERRSILTRVK